MRTPIPFLIACYCTFATGLSGLNAQEPLPAQSGAPQSAVSAQSVPVAEPQDATPPTPIPTLNGYPPPMAPVLQQPSPYGQIPYMDVPSVVTHVGPPISHQPPYYWRVGTRKCKQTFRGGIQNCCLDISGCGPDGRWRPSTLPEMLASVSDGAPICVMAHGSLVDEYGSRIDARGTYRWLRGAAPQLPLHVIFFDWPSERVVGPHAAAQFIQLGRQAARNGFPLAKLVEKFPPDSPVCLIGHSHGARLVCSAAHLMCGGSVQGERLRNPDRHHRLRLVLAAAAIDHHWLNPGERYDRAVVRAESIISIENRKDLALLLYPFQRPLGAASLGQKGLWVSDEQALGPNRRKIFHLDVTSVVGKRHVWPFYYSEPRIAQTIASSVFFPDIYQAVATPLPATVTPPPAMVPPSPINTGQATVPTYPQ